MHTALSFDLVGEDVLVSGAGPIGIMAAAVAKHVGARNVVITDVNEYRLELARKMGITRAVNVAKENLNDVMAELGMTEGFDVGLETVSYTHLDVYKRQSPHSLRLHECWWQSIPGGVVPIGGAASRL